jgi:hypothetical protein
MDPWAAKISSSFALVAATSPELQCARSQPAAGGKDDFARPSHFQMGGGAGAGASTTPGLVEEGRGRSSSTGEGVEAAEQILLTLAPISRGMVQERAKGK